MFEDFERYLLAQDRPQTTIRSYLSDLRQFAVWFQQANGEPPTLRTITPTDLREYRQYMLTVQHLSTNTINRRIASISAYLAWGKHSDQIEDNPARQVRSLKRQNAAPRWLTKQEQRKLEREVEQAVTTARTGSAGRRARRALRAWLDVRSEAESDYVFLGQRGEPLTTSALRRRITELARRTGVEATPHTLRHTFGKRLVDAGTSLEKGAALLEHSNLNTTRL